jgi:hypothetical protein
MKYKPVKIEITTPDGDLHNALAHIEDDIVMAGSEDLPGVSRIDVPISLHRYQYESDDVEHDINNIGEMIAYAINDGSVLEDEWDDGLRFAVVDGNPHAPYYNDVTHVLSAPSLTQGSAIPSWLFENKEEANAVIHAFPHIKFIESVKPETNPEFDPPETSLAVIANIATRVVSNQYGLEQEDTLDMKKEIGEVLLNIPNENRKAILEAIQESGSLPELHSHRLLSHKIPGFTVNNALTLSNQEVENGALLIPTGVSLETKTLQIESKNGKLKDATAYVLDASNYIEEHPPFIAAVTMPEENNKVTLKIGDDLPEIAIIKGKALQTPSLSGIKVK